MEALKIFYAKYTVWLKVAFCLGLILVGWFAASTHYGYKIDKVKADADLAVEQARKEEKEACNLRIANLVKDHNVKIDTYNNKVGELQEEVQKIAKERDNKLAQADKLYKEAMAKIKKLQDNAGYDKSGASIPECKDVYMGSSFSVVIDEQVKQANALLNKEYNP